MKVPAARALPHAPTRLRWESTCRGGDFFFTETYLITFLGDFFHFDQALVFHLAHYVDHLNEYLKF